MFLCTNTKISKIYFREKFTPLFFLRIEPQPPSPLKSEGDPAMINRNRLILLSFGKREDTGGEGIILGENPAGHCFVLRDLIPINFFK